MLARLILGAGLFAIGYYFGKEVGRTEPIRDELRRARDAAADSAEEAPSAGARPGAINPEDADS